jgi:hypothetical protein
MSQRRRPPAATHLVPLKAHRPSLAALGGGRNLQVQAMETIASNPVDPQNAGKCLGDPEAVSTKGDNQISAAFANRERTSNLSNLTRGLPEKTSSPVSLSESPRRNKSLLRPTRGWRRRRRHHHRRRAGGSIPYTTTKKPSPGNTS